MKLHGTSLYTPVARDELRTLADANSLEIVNDKNCLGVLRSTEDCRDPALLNMLLPDAKIAHFYTSSLFAEILREFTYTSGLLHGTDRYLVQGYVGLTQDGGTISHLHADGIVHKRLTKSIGATGVRVKTATPVYVGTEEITDELLSIPSADAMKRLGAENFSQAAEGQTTELSPDDYHMEPQLPAGTPRLFLVSTSWV